MVLTPCIWMMDVSCMSYDYKTEDLDIVDEFVYVSPTGTFCRPIMSSSTNAYFRGIPNKNIISDSLNPKRIILLGKYNEAI